VRKATSIPFTARNARARCQHLLAHPLNNSRNFAFGHQRTCGELAHLQVPIGVGRCFIKSAVQHSRWPALRVYHHSRILQRPDTRCLVRLSWAPTRGSTRCEVRSRRLWAQPVCWRPRRDRPRRVRPTFTCPIASNCTLQAMQGQAGRHSGLPLLIRGGQGRVRASPFIRGSPVSRRANRICGLKRIAPKRRSRGVGFRELFPAIMPHEARQDCRLTKASDALYVIFRLSLCTRRSQAKPGETTREKHSTPSAAL
jgi:hypothetical protein